MVDTATKYKERFTPQESQTLRHADTRGMEFLSGYPTAVKGELESSADLMGVSPLLGSYGMTRALVDPLFKGAASQAADYLLPHAQRRTDLWNERVDALASRMGYDAETFPFTNRVRDREGPTKAEFEKPLYMLLGLSRGNFKIKPDLKKALDRLRLKLKRQGTAVGKPKNERQVLTAPDVEPWVVGDITYDDWKQRALALSPTDVEEYRAWYAEALPTFNRYFGEDVGEIYMFGFLLANKNASPKDALTNILRAVDKARDMPQEKTAGLNEELILRHLLGEQLDESMEGAGQKLFDFVDSAYERETRSWMGDKPEGGAPATVDIHSTRGTGFVDEKLKKQLVAEFGDQAKDLKVDVKRGPLDTQYEYGSQKWNDFSEMANSENFMGGNWTPAQIQAIDWKYTGDRYGGGVETIEEAFQGNFQRISTELVFAPGSLADQRFGSTLKDVNFNDKALITRRVFDQIAPQIFELFGVRGDYSLGIGKYLNYPAVPNIYLDVLTSPERAADVADAFGYVFQQNELIRARNLKTGNTTSLHIKIEEGDATPASLETFGQSLSKSLGKSVTGWSYDHRERSIVFYLERQPRVSPRGMVSKTIESQQVMEARIRQMVHESLQSAGDATGLRGVGKIFRSEAVFHGEENYHERDTTGRIFLDSLGVGRRPAIQAGLEDLREQTLQATADGIRRYSGARHFSVGGEAYGRIEESGGHRIRGGQQSYSGITEETIGHQHEGKLILTHWSNVQDLKTLDPSLHGTGLRGAERERKAAFPETWIDRTYYGLKGYRKEAGLGPKVYTATIDPSELYDFGKDPDGLWPHGSMDPSDQINRYEAAIKKAGYTGYWVKHGDQFAAASFKPLEVNK